MTLEEEINRSPDSLRQYIHDLETFADPSGTIRENHLVADENLSLRLRIGEIKQDTAKLARTVTADHDHNNSLSGSPIPCECPTCRIARSYLI